MLYIIRHGQTDKNKAAQLQGRSDISLNENGRKEAERAGAYFKSRGIAFDRCYSSPLQRAIETAEIVTGFQRSEIIIDDLLLEMDYGPYEGISLQNPPPEIITFFSDFVRNPAPDGMEQLPDVVGRLGEFLEKLPYAAADGVKENILISTHAIAMKGALEYLTPDSGGSYWSKNIGNCSIYAFDKEDGKFTVPKEWYP